VSIASRYREAERDLQEAQRREARARDRLKQATDDLEEARKDGKEAAENAETAGIGLRFALAGLPAGVLAMPGAPAQAQISDAAGMPRPEQRPIPISEQEPPEHWPGFAKSLFKLGRGEWTVIAGTAGLAKKAYDDPEKIPGAVKSGWNVSRARSSRKAPCSVSPRATTILAWHRCWRWLGWTSRRA
jgi:hypothetical protein